MKKLIFPTIILLFLAAVFFFSPFSKGGVRGIFSSFSSLFVFKGGGEVGDLSAQAAAPKTGLVGWWTMDANDVNGINYYDKSGFNNTATSTGSPTIVAGKISQAVSLNGSSQWLNANDNNTLDVNSFTASVWMKGSVISGQNVLVAKWGITGQASFLFDMNSGQPRLILSQNGTDNASINTATNALVTGQWYQVAVVYNAAAQTVVFYVNGSVAASSLTSGAVPSSLKQGTDSLNIGSSVVTGSGYFSGSIDDVRVYNRALSAQEVSQLYNSAKITYTNSATKASSTAQLVGYWTMDTNDMSSTGATLYDRSGQNNHGTVTGTTTSTGKIAQARRFNATGWVSVAHSNSISPTTAITVSVWIKQLGAGSTAWPYFVSKGTTANGYHIYDDTSVIAFFLAGDGVSISSGSRCYGVWCHIVGTWDGSTEKIYRDGVFRNQQAHASAITYDSESLFIGAYTDGVNMPDALIDDVRIYNYALSAQDVANLYSAAKTKYTASAPKSGLVGWWTMDVNDTTPTTTYDRSGRNNNGTPTGFYIYRTPTSTAGKIHEAISFDGSNGYIDTKDIDIIDGATALTVSAWVKEDSLLTNKAIVAKWDYSTQGTFGLQTGAETAGEVTVYIATSLTDDGSGCRVDTTNVVLEAGKWALVTSVFDGSQTGNANRSKIYINGNSVAVTQSIGNVPSSLTSNGTATVKIGKFGGTLSRLFNGSIDDVRVYNRALSAAEVKQLYDSAARHYIQ